MTVLQDFYRRQLMEWPLASGNVKALFGVCTRMLVPAGHEDGMLFVVQHNPARVRSTGAKVDAASVAARPCFLCSAARSGEQGALEPAAFGDRFSDLDYEILINPYPIFPYHFTIPCKAHTPQVIVGDGCRRFDDMLRLAEALEGMALFYNGARCGASAPDHFHFQAVPASAMTILSTERPVPFLTFGYESGDRAEMLEWFVRVVEQICDLPTPADFSSSETEPRMNIICTYTDGIWKALVIPRRAHRPDFYGSGEGQYLISPATVDLSGTIIIPSFSDFDAITPEILASLLSQTTYPVL